MHSLFDLFSIQLEIFVIMSVTSDGTIQYADPNFTYPYPSALPSPRGAAAIDGDLPHDIHDNNDLAARFV